MRKKTVDDLKYLIGKQFNWLTVIDIVETEKRIKCLCRCKCGKEKLIAYSTVIHESIMSCGCYALSDDVKSKRSKSCSEFWINHPDKHKECIEKRKEWVANNKDKIKECGEKLSQYLKDNPEKLAERGKKHSQWFKNNPDAVKRRSEKYRQWVKDNPEKIKSQAENYKQWLKDNPDKVKRMRDAQKATKAANPEKAITGLINHRKKRKEERSKIDYSKLLPIIHPSHINDLLAGDILYSSRVMTKCPKCGNFDEHVFGDVFNMSKENLKLNRVLMCSTCAKSYTLSKYEEEIADFVSSFYTGECIRNSHQIIKPKELDLYYPEKKIAIEFNGDYFHSERCGTPNDYHYNKFKLCLNNKILLVSIFEKEWCSNKNAIKQYLSDLFSNIENNLSFNNDRSMMNNNYPSPLCKISDDTIEDFYTHGDNKVYTCGYSKIIKEQ